MEAARPLPLSQNKLWEEGERLSLLCYCGKKETEIHEGES